MAAAPLAWANEDNWPTRPLRIVVPFTAGSPPDLIARSILPKLSENLGQSVIVDNKPGATTTIGMEHVVRSAPDGYTLLLTATGAASVFPVIMKLRFDPIKDLPPVGMIVTSQQVFFSGGNKRVATLKEFVERARQNPGKTNVGSIGIGTTNHLACELLKKATGIDSTYVPYQSAQAGLQAVMSGDVDLFCADVGLILGFMGSDKITPIAVAGLIRSEFLPNTPTLAESGVNGVVSANRFALFVPAGVTKEVFARLSIALSAAVNSNEATQTFRKMGMIANYAPADAVAEVIRSDAAVMVPLANALNIRIN
jgi:tripartite-type tricarboxylate transporter receptor subunit TctC